MRGLSRVVEAVIKDFYLKSLNTHCVLQSLNLYFSDAAKSQDVRKAFGIISHF